MYINLIMLYEKLYHIKEFLIAFAKLPREALETTGVQTPSHPWHSIRIYRYAHV